MRKLILISLTLLFVAISIINSNWGISISAATESNLKIRAYGDSISYGETLADTNDAYPAVFAKKYIDDFNAEFTPKGVSGDTTTDLLNHLEAYKDGTAADINDFNDTDIITLCIGANNILSPAINSLTGFLLGSITENQFQASLDAGVDKFKEDYPKILEIFNNKKVVVMTVYNPYKYLSLNDIVISPANENLSASIATYDTKLQKLLEMSMTSLQVINDEIRNSASSTVQVVDIWELFSTFTKNQYTEYINADMSKITITSPWDIINILNNFYSTNTDPHPTKAGHKIIAQKHNAEFKMSSFKMDSSNIQTSNDNITFTINTLLDGNFTYKVYKDAGNGPILLKESTTNVISLQASKLEGKNKIFAEIYLNNKLLERTNDIQYELAFKSRAANLSAILYIAILIICIVITVMCFILTRINNKNGSFKY